VRGEKETGIQVEAETVERYATESVVFPNRMDKLIIYGLVRGVPLIENLREAAARA